MNAAIKKITLDQPVMYEIKVPGVIEERWLENFNGSRISIENTSKDSSITTLTTTVDQAALHGILQHIYSMGLPLLSVICVEFSLKNFDNN